MSSLRAGKKRLHLQPQQEPINGVPQVAGDDRDISCSGWWLWAGQGEGSWARLTSIVGMKPAPTLQSSNEREMKQPWKAFPTWHYEKRRTWWHGGKWAERLGRPWKGGQRQARRGRALEPYSLGFKSQLWHLSVLNLHLTGPQLPHLYKEANQQSHAQEAVVNQI